MAPKHKRRELTSRYDDCGRTHKTVSEASWNPSTLLKYALPEQSTRKLLDAMNEERASKYDAPDAMHFSEWVRSYMGTDSAPDADSTFSSSSKIETRSWPGTPASLSKPKNRKHRQISKSQSPKLELRDRRAMHKRDWNISTTPIWRNTSKREQFRNILDGRKLPLLRNEKYMNIKPQYLKVRKRSDILSSSSKKRKRKVKIKKPFLFPLATQCSCEEDPPKTLCPLLCPVEGFIQVCCPSIVSSFDDQSCPCLPFKHCVDNLIRPLSTTQSKSHDDDEPVSIKSHGGSLSSRSDHSTLSTIHSKYRDNDDPVSIKSHGSSRSDHSRTEPEARTVKASSSAQHLTDHATDTHPLSATLLPERETKGKSDTASSKAESSSEAGHPHPSSAVGRHVLRELDSNPKAPSDKREIENDRDCLSRVITSVGLLCRPPVHGEHQAKAFQCPHNVWNCGGVCRMRSPFRACLGENGEDHDF